MKPQIIDTSVAIKWFVDEVGASCDRARDYLERIRQDPSGYVVPELFFNEMLAVFCRLVEDPQQIQEFMTLLENLGFERIGNGHELLQCAATLSKRYSLTGYDSIFVATASLMDGVWVTADHAAVKKLGNSGLTIDISVPA